MIQVFDDSVIISNPDGLPKGKGRNAHYVLVNIGD